MQQCYVPGMLIPRGQGVVLHVSVPCDGILAIFHEFFVGSLQV